MGQSPDRPRFKLGAIRGGARQKPMKVRRNADHHPVNGGSCSLRARLRSVTLTPPSKPDGYPNQFAQRIGRVGAIRESPTQGVPVQDPSERPLIPADVFPLRRAEEATTLAKRTELSNDGRQSSTAVRRADGLATSAALGTLSSNHNQFSARANPNATRRCSNIPNINRHTKMNEKS